MAIRSWLDIAGITYKSRTTVSKDHAMRWDTHQITIEFNHRSDMATFKIGYPWKGRVDIQYF